MYDYDRTWANISVHSSAGIGPGLKHTAILPSMRSFTSPRLACPIIRAFSSG